MPSRIMIVAGEASGDLHGGALVQALRRLRSDLHIFGVGGDRMRQAGMELLYHVKDLSFVGFSEVVRHLLTLQRVYHDLSRVLQARRPDVLVLIDYPGFNLRFARRAKKAGTATFYYIAPQVWAWGRGRAKKMSTFIDRMAVIFEFEVPFFLHHGLPAEFVGHPLLDAAPVTETREDLHRRFSLDPENPLLAILPGSRAQELKLLLPPLLETAARLRARHPRLQVALSLAPTLSERDLGDRLVPHPWITVVARESPVLMKYATAALAASGTATLELALFGTPFAIVYRVSSLSYLLGRRLVKIPRIGLVNVVAGEEVVREFIQGQVAAPSLCAEAEKLLFDEETRLRQKHLFEQVRKMLGTPGAAERTARLVLEACSH